MRQPGLVGDVPVCGRGAGIDGFGRTQTLHTNLSLGWEGALGLGRFWHSLLTHEAHLRSPTSSLSPAGPFQGDEGGQGRAGRDPQPPKLTGEGAAELELRGGLALRRARVLLLGLGERGTSVPWEICSQLSCLINQPSAIPKDSTPICLTFPCENKQQNIKKEGLLQTDWRDGRRCLHMLICHKIESWNGLDWKGP